MVRARSGQRRKTAWKDSLFNKIVASGAAGSASSLLGDWINVDTRGNTLVRMIMCYSVTPEVPHAVTGLQTLDMGIATTSQEAFAAGVVPDANAASDEPLGPWVFRCRHLVANHSALSIYAFSEINRDLRAMRMIGNGELYLTLSNSIISGVAFDVRWHGIIRCLFKLP